MRLKDEIAIVTGTGSGIGQASALRFAEEGATLVLVDIHETNNQGTADLIAASGGTAMSIVADVTSEREVRGMIATTVETYGSLDILFNNAGGGVEAPVAELRQKNWTEMVDLNLKSVFLGCKYAIPEMINGGRRHPLHVFDPRERRDGWASFVLGREGRSHRSNAADRLAIRPPWNQG